MFPQTRREFLRHAASAGIAAAAAPALAQDDESFLRLPVAPTAMPTMWHGAVTPQSATVKAKLRRGARARLLVRELEQSGGEVAFLPEYPGGAAVAAFRLAGLRAATTYTYALEVEGKPSIYPPGILRTFPEEGKPAPVKFAFSSCARTGSESPVFDRIRQRSPDIFLHLGDLHYENIGRNHPRLFRAAWDTVLSSATQGALYREVPMAYVWDDHDFGPNDSDHRSPSRSAARTVYREYAPHYPLAAGDGDAPIYHAFSIGRVRFILTDLRSERDPSAQMDDNRKSMMGDAQKKWFLREVYNAARSHAVVFWVSTVPWIGEHGRDTWAGFSEERRELANFFQKDEIRNLCILCGDAHMLAADDGTESGYSDLPATPIPVLHGSALDQGGSYKGGPYSHGYYTPTAGEGCFGWVEVHDTGSEVTVDFTGRTSLDEVKVAMQFQVG